MFEVKQKLDSSRKYYSSTQNHAEGDEGTPQSVSSDQVEKMADSSSVQSSLSEAAPYNHSSYVVIYRSVAGVKAQLFKPHSVDSLSKSATNQNQPIMAAEEDGNSLSKSAIDGDSILSADATFTTETNSIISTDSNIPSSIMTTSTSTTISTITSPTVDASSSTSNLFNNTTTDTFEEGVFDGTPSPSLTTTAAVKLSSSPITTSPDSAPARSTVTSSIPPSTELTDLTSAATSGGQSSPLVPTTLLPPSSLLSVASRPAATANSKAYVYGYLVEPIPESPKKACKVTILSQFSPDLNRLELNYNNCRKIKMFIEELHELSSTVVKDDDSTIEFMDENSFVRKNRPASATGEYDDGNGQQKAADKLKFYLSSTATYLKKSNWLGGGGGVAGSNAPSFTDSSSSSSSVVAAGTPGVEQGASGVVIEETITSLNTSPSVSTSSKSVGVSSSYVSKATAVAGAAYAVGAAVVRKRLQQKRSSSGGGGRGASSSSKQDFEEEEELTELEATHISSGTDLRASASELDDADEQVHVAGAAPVHHFGNDFPPSLPLRKPSGSLTDHEEPSSSTLSRKPSSSSSIKSPSLSLLRQPPTTTIIANKKHDLIHFSPLTFSPEDTFDLAPLQERNIVSKEPVRIEIPFTNGQGHQLSWEFSSPVDAPVQFSIVFRPYIIPAEKSVLDLFPEASHDKNERVIIPTISCITYPSPCKGSICISSFPSGMFWAVLHSAPVQKRPERMVYYKLGIRNSPAAVLDAIINSTSLSTGVASVFSFDMEVDKCNNPSPLLLHSLSLEVVIGRKGNLKIPLLFDSSYFKRPTSTSRKIELKWELVTGGSEIAFQVDCYPFSIDPNTLEIKLEEIKGDQAVAGGGGGIASVGSDATNDVAELDTDLSISSTSPPKSKRSMITARLANVISQTVVATSSVANAAGFTLSKGLGNDPASAVASSSASASASVVSSLSMFRKETLVPLSKVSSGRGSETGVGGSLTLNERYGVYVMSVDNSFSVVMSKHITLRAWIIAAE